jgi:pimeloyl-ACP methyl ester carboxylesterase
LTGTPSEENCYADIEAVYSCLVKDRGISPHQIVLYGRSVGSGPSCWLAAKTARDGNSVGGLVLHSPFTSVYRVVLNLGFTMVGDKFPNIDNIKQVTCPVMICHGREDGVVPFWHGVQLHSAVPAELQAKPFWMEDVGHNDHGPVAEAALMRNLNRYLDYHILARRLWEKLPQRRLSSPTRVKRRPAGVPRCEV